MQQLIQEDFEITENIGVNLNILPSGTLANTVNPLLLAITSGDGPDVVLNVDANTAVEYGVRARWIYGNWRLLRWCSASIRNRAGVHLF